MPILTTIFRPFLLSALLCAGVLFSSAAHAQCPLCDLAADGDSAGIEEFCDDAENTVDVDGKTGSGQTAVLLAAKKSYFDAIQTLVNGHGPNCAAAAPDIPNRGGRTAYMWAAQEGDIKIASLLVKAGRRLASERPNATLTLTVNVHREKNDGRNAADLALEEGNVRFLIHQVTRHTINFANNALADGDLRDVVSLIKAYDRHLGIPMDDDGDSITDDYPVDALFYAAEQGNAGAIRALVGFGVDVNSTKDGGNTALHIAVENDQVDAINALVRIESIDVNLLNDSGYAPLHIAVKENKKEAIRALGTASGLLVNQGTTSEDETAYMLAAANGMDDIARLLIRIGETLALGVDVHRVNAGGENAADLARENGHVPFLVNQVVLQSINFTRNALTGDELRQIGDLVRAYFRHQGMLMDDSEEMTGNVPVDAFFYSVRQGNAHAMRAFVKIGVDINSTKTDGRTAADVAYDADQYAILMELLVRGVDLEERGDDVTDTLTYRYLVSQMRDKFSKTQSYGDYDDFLTAVLSEGDFNPKIDDADGNESTLVRVAVARGFDGIQEAIVKDVDLDNSEIDLTPARVTSFVQGMATFRDRSLEDALIHYAAPHPFIRGSIIPGGDVEYVRLLLALGADVNHQSSDGIALHRAAIRGDLAVVEVLLSADDINATLFTPFPAAVMAHNDKSVPVLRALVEHINDVSHINYHGTNYQDGEGDTALHDALWVAELDASEGGGVNALNYLLEAGADVFIPTGRKYSGIVIDDGSSDEVYLYPLLEGSGAQHPDTSGTGEILLRHIRDLDLDSHDMSVVEALVYFHARRVTNPSSFPYSVRLMRSYMDARSDIGFSCDFAIREDTPWRNANGMKFIVWLQGKLSGLSDDDAQMVRDVFSDCFDELSAEQSSASDDG